MCILEVAILARFNSAQFLLSLFYCLVDTFSYSQFTHCSVLKDDFWQWLRELYRVPITKPGKWPSHFTISLAPQCWTFMLDLYVNVRCFLLILIHLFYLLSSPILDAEVVPSETPLKTEQEGQVWVSIMTTTLSNITPTAPEGKFVTYHRNNIIFPIFKRRMLNRDVKQVQCHTTYPPKTKQLCLKF